MPESDVLTLKARRQELLEAIAGIGDRRAGTQCCAYATNFWARILAGKMPPVLFPGCGGSRLSLPGGSVLILPIVLRRYRLDHAGACTGRIANHG